MTALFFYLMNLISYKANFLISFLNHVIQIHLSNNQLLENNHLNSLIILLVEFCKISSYISDIFTLSYYMSVQELQQYYDY